MSMEDLEKDDQSRPRELKLDVESQEREEIIDEEDESPVDDDSLFADDYEEYERQKRKRIITSMVVMGVIVAAGAAFFIYNKEQTSHLTKIPPFPAEREAGELNTGELLLNPDNKINQSTDKQNSMTENNKKYLENLPRWNLADLYSGIDSPALQADQAAIFTKAEQFAQKYRSKLGSLSAADLLKALKEYEEILDLSSKVGYYPHLSLSVNSNDTKMTAFNTSIKQKLADLDAALTFFTLELSQFSKDHINQLMAESSTNGLPLAKYDFYLNNYVKYKDHLLGEETEKYAIKKSLTSSMAWVQLYEKLMTELRFEVDGESLTLSEVTNFSDNPDRSKRQAAAQALNKVFSENSTIFSGIYNAIIHDRASETASRHYSSPIAARNIANDVEDEVVNALIEVVKKNYGATAHRYYKIKKKLLGLDKLEPYDIFAPVIKDEPIKRYTWDEAKEIVLSSYKSFSPKMSEIASMFFEKKWIDAPMDKFKASGAFCASVGASVHPYVLVNYAGKMNDVFTLAHELGHGIHFYLSNPLGPILSSTPLTLAETASIFGEQLVFDKVIKEIGPDNKTLLLSVLADKIEDVLATVVRQISFVEFEKLAHEAGKNTQLSAEDLNKIWFKVQTEALGPDVNYTNEVSTRWMSAWHFFGVPFYVYSYAFGQLLVNSIYSLYQQNKIQGFPEKYIELLSKGGMQHHKDLLAPFGIDISQLQFWQNGMDQLISLIDKFEKLADEIEADKKGLVNTSNTTPTPTVATAVNEESALPRIEEVPSPVVSGN